MYRKALTVDPNFAPSRTGIASNLMFQGKHDAARKEAWKAYEAARNDGERRGALFATAVAYADEGKFDNAVAELKKEYAVAEKINDAAAMSGDAVAMGDVLLEAGKPEEARKRYLQALELVQQSDLSPEVKEDTKLVHHFNLGRVAVRAGDLPGAKQHAAAFMKGATVKKNAAETRQAHELAGTIALAEKNFDQAVAELSQGNQQDAYTLYRLALAYREKGDEARAGELFQKVANHNSLPALNYSFVRAKAKRMRA
jgi:tetratricopeptide (TPR) repeat protein